MYLGSVRFFKHLIYALIILIIILPITLSIVFVTKYFSFKNDLERASLAIAQQEIKEPDILTQDELCDFIKEEGYSPYDILKALDNNENDFIDELYTKHFGTDKFSDYQTKFNELNTQPPKQFVYEENTVYLTFDDGPSINTTYILDILDKYDIKATFFVTGNETQEGIEIIKEIVKRGHTIGIHSYSHDLDAVYFNVEAFLSDLDKCREYIYKNTGVKPSIIRFAGGSINNHNRFIYDILIAEITRRGYVYYDWNVSGEDAQIGANWTSIYRNITQGMSDKERAIILLHDSSDKYNTVLTIEDIIVYIKDRGYEFDKLDNSIMPIVFN